MARWTDKPFITQGEHSTSNTQKPSQTTEQLPLNCCMLSLKPFDAPPVCAMDGYIFDSNNIQKYLKDHNNRHPFDNQQTLQPDQLVRLQFKEGEGGFVDPVTLKPFGKNTRLAAIRTSGQVYAKTTVDEFNVKPKSWNDLVTGEAFTQKDIIELKRTHQFSNTQPQEEITTKKPKESNRHHPYNAASHSKGLAAASLTSTAVAPVTRNEAARVDDLEYMLGRIKQPGYLRLVTNLGDLNLELYCDKVPRTCYNFVQLAKSGYYQNTVFHRSIKNFMIQGGDPTGTGKGGESVWGKPFGDEIRSSLKHMERGVLSMANHGKNTNGSQFFILYRAAGHLDGKHTVFGRVVGGLEVLGRMEQTETDEQDRPAANIVLKDTKVFVDPFEEFQQRLERKLEHQERQRQLESGQRQRTAREQELVDRQTTTWMGTRATAGQPPAADSKKTEQGTGGVGKYMKKPAFQTPPTREEKKKKQPSGYTFRDFTNW